MSNLGYLLDSFYIAPDEGICHKQRTHVPAENKRVQCLTIMESAGDINPQTDQLYNLSGRLLHYANINLIVLRRRFSSGMLITIRKNDERNHVR
jgi:hypothetical protein